MRRPPLLFLYPSYLHPTSDGHLLRPLRPRHFTSSYPPRRQSILLRQHPHPRLAIRQITTTSTSTTPPSILILLRRRLAPSLPTLTLLSLSYVLYSLTYTLMPVSGSSMSPLLNPSSLDGRGLPLSKRWWWWWRRDWVWVEMWPSPIIRFADARLNPSTSPYYSPSSASSSDGDDDKLVEEQEGTRRSAAAAPVLWWRDIRNPMSRRKTTTTYKGSRGLIRRGIVVALYSPTSCTATAAGGGGAKLLVKRIVALPGDVVVPRPGARYPRRRVVVPEGCVWVEGDNEVGEGSWDSNFFGPVGMGMVVGRVGGKVWPLGRWGSLEQGEVGRGWWPGRARVVEGGGERVRRWSGGDDGGVGDVG